MKRIAVVALALSAALSSALAQAQGFDPAKISGKITFYTHFSQFIDDGHWAEWAAEFTKAYPGTEVEVLPVSNYRKEMPTRISSGDYGDVLNVLDNLPPSEYENFTCRLTTWNLRNINSSWIATPSKAISTGTSMV